MTITKTSITKTSITKTSITKTSITKTSITKTVRLGPLKDGTLLTCHSGPGGYGAFCSNF